MVIKDIFIKFQLFIFAQLYDFDVMLLILYKFKNNIKKEIKKLTQKNVYCYPFLIFLAPLLKLF